MHKNCIRIGYAISTHEHASHGCVVSTCDPHSYNMRSRFAFMKCRRTQEHASHGCMVFDVVTSTTAALFNYQNVCDSRTCCVHTYMRMFGFYVLGPRCYMHSSFTLNRCVLSMCWIHAVLTYAACPYTACKCVLWSNTGSFCGG